MTFSGWGWASRILLVASCAPAREPIWMYVQKVGWTSKGTSLAVQKVLHMNECVPDRAEEPLHVFRKSTENVLLPIHRNAANSNNVVAWHARSTNK